MTMIIRQGAGVLAARVSSAAIQGVSLLVLARNTNISTFGLFSALYLSISALAIGFDLGLESYVLRTLSLGRRREAGGASWLHRRHMTWFALVSSTAATPLIAHLGGPWSWGLLVCVWSALERRLNLHMNALIALDRAGLQLLPILVARAPALLIVVVAPRVADPFSWFVCLNMAGLGVALLLHRAMLPVLVRMTRAERASLRREARNYWYPTVSWQLRIQDITIVALCIGPVAAGLYAVPYRLVAPLRIIATSMSAAALPAAAKSRTGELDRLFRNIRVITCVLGVALCLMLPWWRTGVSLVLGPQFADGSTALFLLMAGVLVNLPGAVYSGALQGLGAVQFVGRLGSLLVLSHYLLLIPLTLRLGVNGAALAVLINNIIQGGASWYKFHSMRGASVADSDRHNNARTT